MPGGGGGRPTEVEETQSPEHGLFPGLPTLENPLLICKRQESAWAGWASSRQPLWRAPPTPRSPRGLLPWAGPKQVSTLALGFQVFSQPAPPHLIAFQSANPWPTPSAPARRATSVWPAVASETSHGSRPSLGQPASRLPLPKPHPLRSSPHLL